MGAEFMAISPDIDEGPLAGEEPLALVERLALGKALAVSPGRDNGVVLGSDTIVVLDGDILNKPADPAEARRMLERLSGRTHMVLTGFALVELESGRRHVDHERTEVTFRTIDEEEIEQYVASGAPLDKAGAYGIQDDFGAVFIERIAGDYYTVVGLPLTKVYMALRRIASGK